MPDGCEVTPWRRLRDEWWLVWRVWLGRRLAELCERRHRGEGAGFEAGTHCLEVSVGNLAHRMIELELAKRGECESALVFEPGDCWVLPDPLP